MPALTMRDQSTRVIEAKLNTTLQAGNLSMNVLRLTHDPQEFVGSEWNDERN